MSKLRMVKEAEIDKGYEFYQIIKDFDNPIQIFREAFQNSIDENATEVWCKVFTKEKLGGEDLYIDIWDNGTGLKEEDIPCFFGLAKSTKITTNKTPLGKLGYKGHGTKIFFNSEMIEIFSKTTRSKPGFGVRLEDPINQIRKDSIFRYSELIKPENCSIPLLENFTSGFYLRIKNPYYFKTQHTRFMLNHMYLRDYSKWYTVFGNIKALFNQNLQQDIFLYLYGLNLEYFKNSYNSLNQIDPVPEFFENDFGIFEKIEMGHYFPSQRSNDGQMKSYVKKIEHNKPYYDYYAKEIYRDVVYLDNNVRFDFVIYVEGYETKRRYDILLSRRGKTSVHKSLIHTDSERYGLWACKGYIPIEKIDDWIAGGKGLGTYTYMHAFVNCENFELTANRGSIRNTDLEILEKIKVKINDILLDKKIQRNLSERQEWEEMEKKLRSIDEDEEELKKRFKASGKKNYIILPNGFKIPEPTKTRSGYSESETLIVLTYLISNYPDFFPFKILDYNTTKGIDFVIQKGGFPKYIELKGTLQKKINHSFRNIYKFICYDIALENDDLITDIEELEIILKIKKDDTFQSFNENFQGKKYTSYLLMPNTAAIESMEVLVLKKILTEVIGATIE